MIELTYDIPSSFNSDGLKREIESVLNAWVEVIAIGDKIRVYAPDDVNESVVAAIVSSHSGALSAEQQAELDLYQQIQTHKIHLRDYMNANAGSITNANTVHAVQDLIRVVRYMSRRLVDE